MRAHQVVYNPIKDSNFLLASTSRSYLIVSFNSDIGLILHWHWNRYLMRRSNCSVSIPPPSGQPRGQRKNVCDKKGGTGKWSEKRAGHWKMERLKWLISAGQGTLRTETLAGRNFRDFREFGSISRKLMPGKKLNDRFAKVIFAKNKHFRKPRKFFQSLKSKK